MQEALDEAKHGSEDLKKQLDVAVKRHAALQKDHAPCSDVIVDLEAQVGPSDPTPLPSPDLDWPRWGSSQR